MDSHHLSGFIGAIKFNEIGGKKVCNVSLAINLPSEKTSWHNIAFWGPKEIERLKKDYVKVGSYMILIGKNQYARPYIDKNGDPQAQLCMTGIRFEVINTVKHPEKVNETQKTPPETELDDVINLEDYPDVEDE